MRKVWAVIRREFQERVRSRQFLIGTMLGPILLGLLFVMPVLLQRNTRAKRIVVVDVAQSGFGARVENVLKLATRNDKPTGEKRYIVNRVVVGDRPLDQVRDSLVARIDRRDLEGEGVDGILLADDLALTRDTIEYYGANVGSPAEMGALNRNVRQAVLLEKLTRNNVNPQMLASLAKPVELTTLRVSQGTMTGQSGEASFLLAYIMSFVLYMALLLYGMQVLTSTVEEKTNRINEVLVSSMTPFQLLLGKVVGVFRRV